MSCLSPQDASRYVSGELGAEAQAAASAHLATCAACTARVESERAGREATAPGVHSLPPATIEGEDTTAPGRTLPGMPPGLPTARAPEVSGPNGLGRGTPVGRYLVVERLGEGGMGAVYLAYDPELDRRVALKLLRSDDRDPQSEMQRARLLREAQAMARLAHPNVVSVYDAGVFGRRVFVAMEYVEGMTLARWLKAKERPWREVLDLFVQAGQGLAAAHAAGLVHRDFKADNVLVGKDGRPRVTDFGLAHLEGQARPKPISLPPQTALTLTTPGQMIGTPAYMAPEQFLGQPTDARTDQFNFCAALYEALYQQLPFAGTDLHSLAASTTRGQVSPPPRNSPVPGWVRERVLRGLRLRPEERHASLEALLQALAEDPAVRRRQVLAAVGSALLLAATLGVGGRVVYLEQTRCAREAEQGVAAFWSPEQARTLEQALGSEGAGPAALSHLRAFAQRWREAQVAVCEQGRARAAAPATAQRRADCLKDLAARAATGEEMLLQADQATRPRAAAVLSELLPPDRCVSAGESQPQGHDAEDRFRADLARGQAMIKLRRLSDAEAVVARVRAALDASGAQAPGVRAELLHIAGQVLVYRNERLEQALEDYRSCARLAESVAEDQTVAACRMAEVLLLGQTLNRYDEAGRAMLEARAAVARAGAEAEYMDAELDRLEGNIGVNKGDAAAVALLERALARQQHLYDHDVPELAWVYNDLGRAVGELQGDVARAGQLFARGGEVYANIYGPDAPALGTFWLNAGSAEDLADHPEAALALYGKALAVVEAKVSELPTDVADVLVARASTLLDLNRAPEARADLARAEALAQGREFDSASEALLHMGFSDLARREGQGAEAARRAERAVALAAQRPGEVDVLAVARFTLAQALPPSERARARELANQALDGLATRKTPQAKRRAAEVRAWLAQAPGVASP